MSTASRVPAVPASAAVLLHRKPGADVLVGVSTFAALLSAWAVWQSPVVADPKVAGPLRGLLVLSWALAGAYSWSRKPASRFGLLMIMIALVYSAGAATAFRERPLYVLGRLDLVVM